MRSRAFIVLFLVVAVVATCLSPIQASPAEAQGTDDGSPGRASDGGPEAPRAEPWSGGQAEAGPSEGTADYRIDPATGEVMWPGESNETLEVPAPDDLSEFASVEVDPLAEPRDPSVPVGFDNVTIISQQDRRVVVEFHRD